MKHLSILAIFLVGILTFILLQEKNDIRVGIDHIIHSEILNEDRIIRIHLPSHYEATKEYPVIYLLDGETNFNFASATIDILTYAKKMPPSIIVAIHNTNRARDLTPTHSENGLDGAWIDIFKKNSGGADNFLEFITSELIPNIDNNYSTNDYRVLVGHSNGGLFTLYALLKKPVFFNSYIAIDPSLIWDDQVMLKILNDRIDEPMTSASLIYIATANNEKDPYLHNERFRRAQNIFAKALSNWELAHLNVKLEYLQNDDHITSIINGIRNGIEFVFAEQKNNDKRN